MPLEVPAAAVDGIALRASEPRDEPFLRALYRDVRDPELALTAWSEAQKRAFSDDQFSLQDRHYRAHYRDAAFLVIERGGQPVGRIYIAAFDAEIRLMELSLVAAARNAGLGTRIIRWLQQKAAAEGAQLTLNVETFNPALRLYARLGFGEESRDGMYVRMRWRAPAS